MKDLDEFIKNKDVYLKKEVADGNYVDLVQMMRSLNDVRERTLRYDGLFEPIAHKISLLKCYGEQISDDVFEKVQVSIFVLLLILLFMDTVSSNMFCNSRTKVPQIKIFERYFILNFYMRIFK